MSTQAKISLLYKIRHIMSLPTIQNVLLSSYSHLSLWLMIYFSSVPSLVLAIIIWCLVLCFIIFRAYLTFVEAVILIFKHATFLCPSYSSSESALTQAEMEFCAANTELKIQQCLMASSQEHSVELFTDFIMTNDIGLFILASIMISSYLAFSFNSVFRWYTYASKRSLV